MKILVTGGAGFVGSHIAQEYLNAGHEVVVIDNLSSGKKKNVPRKARFYRADIRDFRAIAKIFATEKPEVVNHQAAVVSVVDSVKNPGETYEVNTYGTLNLLLAGTGSVQRFIFASTGGALYGNAKLVPTPEDAPLTPLSPYGHSKQAAEALIASLAPMLGYTFVILRPSNIFGARQTGSLIAISWKAITSRKLLKLYGATVTRDYVYVRDVAKAHVAALKNGDNQIFNIASGIEYTNMQTIKAVANALAQPVRLLETAPRSGEVLRSCLDATLAKKNLGWTPSFTLEAGLHDMLTYDKNA